MNKYEIMFIVRPDMEEAQIKAVAEEMKKVLDNGTTTFVEEKSMGQRELAYEINKFNTGYYFLYVVETTSDVEKEFTRVAGINESILRSLVVRVED